MSLKALALLPLAVTALLASSQAFAQATQCPAGSVRAFNLNSLLPGNTVCGVRGADRWQEYHDRNGDLVDYKRGPTDKVDPTEKVGTWSIREGIITHTYGSASYNWIVCAPANPVTTSSTLLFRSTGGSGDVSNVTLKAGGPVSCN